ncbi:MAG: hypothetical protein Q8N96_16330 [Methylovulum sp.]|nr:hypothetical protein [Methylovulum sp.]
MDSNERLNAGLKALPDKISSCVSTQAAWRFYKKNLSAAVLKVSSSIVASAPYACMIGRT